MKVKRFWWPIGGRTKVGFRGLNLREDNVVMRDGAVGGSADTATRIVVFGSDPAQASLPSLWWRCIGTRSAWERYNTDLLATGGLE